MIFALPRVVNDLSACHFYHSMEIPGYGLVQGPWDLRPAIDQYLGRYNFRGKRILDVGTASGFLTFSMEKAGAEVVSYDLSEDHLGTSCRSRAR
jgi:2-polyprenyl-3-methyl-5-hydroxy-6-metoxy-1,4-benzoquinol methylase